MTVSLNNKSRKIIILKKSLIEMYQDKEKNRENFWDKSRRSMMMITDCDKN